jgi:hypothetical protein
MADHFDSGIDAERFTDRDHPLIYSCRAPGFAEAIGMKPQGADQELVLDAFLTNLGMAGETEKPLSYSRHRGHYRRSRYRPRAFIRRGMKDEVYARGDYWDERVKMMQWWADFCDTLRTNRPYDEPVILRRADAASKAKARACTAPASPVFVPHYAK